MQIGYYMWIYLCHEKCSKHPGITKNKPRFHTLLWSSSSLKREKWVIKAKVRLRKLSPYKLLTSDSRAYIQTTLHKAGVKPDQTQTPHRSPRSRIALNPYQSNFIRTRYLSPEKTVFLRNQSRQFGFVARVANTCPIVSPRKNVSLISAGAVKVYLLQFFWSQGNGKSRVIYSTRTKANERRSLKDGLTPSRCFSSNRDPLLPLAHVFSLPSFVPVPRDWLTSFN